MKWYIASTLITGVMSVLITFLMTWNFDSKYIGVYGLVSSTAAFFLLVFYLGLDQALVRNFNTSENKKNTLYNCLLPCLIFFIIGSSVFLLNYSYFSKILYGESSLLFIILTCCLIFLMLIQRFFLLIIRCDGESKNFAINNILNKFFYILYILVFIIFSLESKVFSLIYGLLASILICNIFLLRSVYKYLTFDKSLYFDKKYFKYAIPLLFSTFIIGLLGFLDKFLISKWYGLNDLGKYVVVYNAGLIFSYFTSLVNIIWMPFVFKNQNKNIIEVINRFLSLIGYAAIFSASAFFLIKDYISFIFPQEYGGLIKFIYFILINCIVYTWSEIPSSIILLKNKSIYNLVAALFNLGLVVLCIPILKNNGFEYFFLIFFLGNILALILKLFLARIVNERFSINLSLFLVLILVVFSFSYFFDYTNVWTSWFLMMASFFLMVKYLIRCYIEIKSTKYEL
ncbi:hypothetical protein F994_03022 [Acinetobacter bohemicus ANC 3994]|uniref:Polysaccharide biosynthesis protein C-terminal domain-containing protein n=1 Tax=Acinetobacter bohemicus ANC 3994 TaxID=1217715 RepID=N8Q9B6_9GAMM|nr:oligosaccharide flippase family protein [Acinetobacter bohemicus]ENU18502.1 hypothetical protein F994_03022 [Acinetobacter bohemicus ANC 3994]